MTSIGKLSALASLLSIISFWTWERGRQTAILYPIGSFWAKWFFTDYGSPGRKLPYRNYALDGPPLVFNFNPVMSVTAWPYAFGEGEGQYESWDEFDFDYSTSVPIGSSDLSQKGQRRSNEQVGVTPIKGLYGVAYDDKQALYPNDYIAKRIMGADHDINDLRELEPSGSDIKYNKRVFGDVNPWTSYIVGPNNSNDPMWENPKKIQVPLTNGVTGIFMPPYLTSKLNTQQRAAYLSPTPATDPNDMNAFYLTSQRGYSGAEYSNDYIPNTASLEWVNATQGLRPSWNFWDMNAKEMTSSYPLGEPAFETTYVYAGESFGTNDAAQHSGVSFLTPDFSNPYSGVANEFSANQISWGDTDMNSPIYGGKAGNTTYYNSVGPVQAQYAYINDFLKEIDVDGFDSFTGFP